jgi:hypothetical protein
MPGVFMSTVGGPTAGQGYATIKPRHYRPDGTRRWIVWVHFAGVGALDHWRAGIEGCLRLLSAIGDVIPILVIDGGAIPGSGTDNGLFNIGNDALIATIADAVAWVTNPAKGGGKTDKVILGASSQGTSGILNYARANPTKVAALWAALPASDLADIRNNNRPNGWTGTTPNSPPNVNSINAAYGLVSKSTSDYPTHGTSLSSIPANHDPAASDLSPIVAAGIPDKAWYAPSDPTALQATVLTTWVNTLGGTRVAISPDAGHTDTSIGAVPATDVISFLAPYAA